MEPDRWELTFFGDVVARYGQDRYFVFPSVYAKRLLTLLAVSKSLHDRVEVATILWPEVETATARRNLCNELDRIKREWRRQNLPAFLTIKRDELYLLTGRVETDLRKWERSLLLARRSMSASERIEHLKCAVQLYTGPLVHGVSSEYLDGKRVEYATSYLNILLELSRTLAQFKDLPASIHYARIATETAPLDEDAHILLIEQLLYAGREVEARRAYHDFKQRLWRELHMLPSEELRLLLPQPLHAGSRPHANATPTVTSDTSLRSPLYTDPFFGREEELKSLTHMLQPEMDGDIDGATSRNRIVTLVGPPGSGKTRLAVECTRRLARSFQNAIWFIPLADVLDASYVAHHICNAVGLSPEPKITPLGQLVSYLNLRPSLLVLDNMEHLAEEVLTLLVELRQQVGSLRLLLTSRQPLGIPDETILAVPPLPLLDDSHIETALSDMQYGLDTVRRTPCIALFENRARNVRERFVVNRRSIHAVAQICHMLDGIPLAIEIAARRSRSFSPAEILKQLQHSLLSIRNHSPSASRRHRTLELTLDGSYRMLNADQQCFFSSLSLFHGGWDLDAVWKICIRDKPGHTGDYLSLLVGQSLVVAETAHHTLRYRMLRVIWEFARVKLELLAEAESLRERHAEYYHNSETASRPRPLRPRQSPVLSKGEVAAL